MLKKTNKIDENKKNGDNDDLGHRNSMVSMSMVMAT